MARAKAEKEEEADVDLEAAAAEAVRQAAAEGLTLELSDNAIGFKGVSRSRHRFRAQLGAHGQSSFADLGSFDTAEEAALACARKKEERVGQRRSQ